MKGSYLDTLAALCGADGEARMENEVEESSPGGSGQQAFAVAGLPSSGAPALQILPGTDPPSVPLTFNGQQMSFGNVANPFTAASMAAVMQAAAATQPTSANSASSNAIQQLAYYQYIQFAAQAAALQAQAQVAARGNLTQQQQPLPPAQVPFDVTKSAVPFTFASSAPQLSHQPGKPSMFDHVELFMVESGLTRFPLHHERGSSAKEENRWRRTERIYQNWQLLSNLN